MRGVDAALHEAHAEYTSIRVRQLVRDLLATGSTPKLGALRGSENDDDNDDVQLDRGAQDALWRARGCKVRPNADALPPIAAGYAEWSGDCVTGDTDSEWKLGHFFDGLSLAVRAHIRWEAGLRAIPTGTGPWLDRVVLDAAFKWVLAQDWTPSLEERLRQRIVAGVRRNFARVRKTDPIDTSSLRFDRRCDRGFGYNDGHVFGITVSDDIESTATGGGPASCPEDFRVDCVGRRFEPKDILSWAQVTIRRSWMRTVRKQGIAETAGVFTLEATPIPLSKKRQREGKISRAWHAKWARLGRGYGLVVESGVLVEGAEVPNAAPWHLQRVERYAHAGSLDEGVKLLRARTQQAERRHASREARAAG